MTGQYSMAMEYAEMQRRYGRGEMHPMANYPGSQWTNKFFVMLHFAMYGAASYRS